MARHTARRSIATILIGVFAVLSAIPIYLRLGSEFMPPLNEGEILYMPTTLPNLAIGEAARQLGRQDAILRKFPDPNDHPEPATPPPVAP